jgi:isopentenyldiphosphate isomerase
MPELFDVYDAHGQPLGVTKPREEVHRDGDWHRSAHIWVVTPDGCLLFQRRAVDKDTWPGRLDASIGGHYRAGEDGEGSVREAREELGIAITRAELIPLGVRRVEGHGPGGIVDRELQDVYLLQSGLPLTSYRPDPVELDGLVLMSATMAASLAAGSLDRAQALALPRDATAPVMQEVTPDDFIPGRASYLAALRRAVDSLLAGTTLPHLGQFGVEAEGAAQEAPGRPA